MSPPRVKLATTQPVTFKPNRALCKRRNRLQSSEKASATVLSCTFAQRERLFTVPRLTRLASSGDLAHLFREAGRAELAREVVQRSRLILVHQPLEEEQERQVAGLLILH